MDNQSEAVYCLYDDHSRALYHHDDSQCKMSDAEVMTTAIMAMFFFDAIMNSELVAKRMV